MMSDSIRILYDKYLHHDLSEEEFNQFRDEISQVSDDKLWQIMSDEDALTSLTIPERQKEKILNAIYRMIRREKRIKILRYAAVLMVLFVMITVAFFYAYNDDAERQQLVHVEVPYGDKASIILPDGTKMMMNSGTKISYDVVQGKRREVYIEEGEAFFDVTKDARCPFHVMVGNMKIEVLGTQFNVNGYHPEFVETSLLSGSIRLTADNLHEDYQLLPGQKSIYSKQRGKIVIKNNNPYQDMGWKDGYMVFDSSPLHDVLTQMERWYGVSIVLENKSIADDLLTGSYHHESLEGVLHSLSMQYNLIYNIRGDTVYIE